MPSQHEKNLKKKKKKTLKVSSKQKIYPFKEKKKKTKNWCFGRIGRIGKISYDSTILYDLIYDPTIFTILVRF